jgi:pimeloyl-ACP methyl ester carboxylesterase
VPTFTSHDGEKLAYTELGEGRPLVLLHGFMATGAQWVEHGHAADLAEHGHRVILPDLRGHAAPYPPDVLVDDGLALVAELGLTDYDLGGYSLGARVAFRMLVRGARPARAVIGGQGLVELTKEQADPRAQNRRVLTALANGTPLEPADQQLASWINGDPAALLAVLDSLVQTPEAEVRAVQTPTLVVVGTEDERQASAEALAAALPHATLVRVPGNHFTALGNVAPAIQAFLA